MLIQLSVNVSTCLKIQQGKTPTHTHTHPHTHTIYVELPRHHCLSLTQLLQQVPWYNTRTLSLQASEPGWFLRSPEAASALTSSVQPLLMCTSRVASGLPTGGDENGRSEGGRPGLGEENLSPELPHQQQQRQQSQRQQQHQQPKRCSSYSPNNSSSPRQQQPQAFQQHQLSVPDRSFGLVTVVFM